MKEVFVYSHLKHNLLDVSYYCYYSGTITLAILHITVSFYSLGSSSLLALSNNAKNVFPCSMLSVL